jgi:FkbM family methyltransferase
LVNIRFIREVGPLRWAFRTAIRQFYKRVLRRDHRMRLPIGGWITLPVSSRFATEAYVTGADVDWGSERLLAALMDGTGAFLDVGANIGYYSLYFAPLASAVYSFEPDPRVRQALERNVASNPRIHVLPFAVGAVKGKARFVLERDAEVSHLLRDGQASGNEIEVEVMTLDVFAAERGLRVEAIKIDVEGHDREVIEGALTIMRQQHPVVLTESPPDAELFRLTRETGYRVFGYVRHRQTRKRHFAELQPDVPTSGETKMLFLVPERLVERILLNADRT